MTTPLPRAEFAVTRDFVYLNHASAGPLPRSSASAIETFVRAQTEAGVRGTFPYDCEMPKYRATIGGFIGAEGAQIAIVPNTSTAAGIIGAGFDWNDGDEVVLGDNEFPANAIPWVALRRRGVTVRLLDMARERLTPDRLRRELSPRTRLVAVSWVSYADGYRHALAALAAVAHEAGALFCVDAMQGLGVLPLDVAAIDADAVYAGGAKWMLSLHGVAILYLGERIQARLQLIAPGWRSVEDMWDFHNYTQPYSPNAMRFESGTPNLIGTLSLVAAVELLQRSGKDAIAAHVLQLTDRLCEGLQGLGAELCAPRGEGISSAIVTFKLPGRDSIEVGRALEKQSILATYRPGGVRISPHGYNTLEEIDVCLQALERIHRGKVMV